jgi:hypothetical protein
LKVGKQSSHASDGAGLSPRTDLEHYHSELQREKDEIKEVPETERARSTANLA